MWGFVGAWCLVGRISGGLIEWVWWEGVGRAAGRCYERWRGLLAGLRWALWHMSAWSCWRVSLERRTTRGGTLNRIKNSLPASPIDCAFARCFAAAR